MKRIVLLFIIIFTCYVHSYSQVSIIIDSVTYFDNTNQRYDLTTITIKNEDMNNIILWISDSIEGTSMEEGYYQYFFKTNNDFSLASLMIEKISTKILPIIGSTFYKRILPQNSFTIIFIGTMPNSKFLDYFINRQLHYISESSVRILEDVNRVEYLLNQLVIKTQ